jgi:hypothetical protein
MKYSIKIAFVFASFVLLQPSCGRDRRPGGAATQSADDGDGTPTLIHEDGAEGPVSTDPHPAACGPADIAAVNPVPACPNVVGKPVPSEGDCFVASTVTPRWDTEPPSSGPMYGMPNWQWGEHTEVVPRGTWVHNLAHGFIVITYNCPNGCDAELASVRKVLAAKRGFRLLMTADPLLTSSRFAALAWTYVLQFDTPDEAALACFIDQHEKQGVHGR